MRILIVAATENELAAIRNYCSKKSSLKNAVDFIVTGVGMTATAYCLTRKLSEKKYDLAINVGIAGSFRHEIGLGDVVNVVSETFADLGAEDGSAFLSVFDLGLQGSDSYPFWNGKIKNEHSEKFMQVRHLKNVKGITVNKVHGSAATIQSAFLKFHPDIESMEGAAFFYVCAMERIPYLQLRAVSNRVERRDKGSWKIGIAIENLSATVHALLDDLVKNHVYEK